MQRYVFLSSLGCLQIKIISSFNFLDSVLRSTQLFATLISQYVPLSEKIYAKNIFEITPLAVEFETLHPLFLIKVKFGSRSQCYVLRAVEYAQLTFLAVFKVFLFINVLSQLKVLNFVYSENVGTAAWMLLAGLRVAVYCFNNTEKRSGLQISDMLFCQITICLGMMVASGGPLKQTKEEQSVRVKTRSIDTA